MSNQNTIVDKIVSASMLDIAANKRIKTKYGPDCPVSVVIEMPDECSNYVFLNFIFNGSDNSFPAGFRINLNNSKFFNSSFDCVSTEKLSRYVDYLIKLADYESRNKVNKFVPQKNQIRSFLTSHLRFSLDE